MLNGGMASLKYQTIFLLTLIVLTVMLICSFSRSLRWNGTSPITKSFYQLDPSILELLEENPISFWDCDLQETPCHYFKPYDFFHEETQFLSDYKRLGGNNNNLPAITALSWSGPTSDKKKLWYLPRNISFIHVHKAGGTTVQTLLAHAKKDLVHRSATASFETFKYSIGGGTAKRKEYNQKRRQQHIDSMARLVREQAKQQSNSLQISSAIVFTTVRDPIERFVSAVQQVMHYNQEFRSKCLRWTPTATLRCAIEYTRQTDYLRDVHTVPMATHFRLWNEKPDFQLAVLHLRDIQALAHYFSADSSNVPHGRDRTQVGYATSQVLAHMSVRDCTHDMLAELCHLYAIDVKLMKRLGFNTPYCVPS